MNANPAVRPVCRALHKPLLWFGVERPLAMTAAMTLVIAFNLSGVIVAVVLAASLYTFAAWLRYRDEPTTLRLWLMPLSATRYDAMKRQTSQVRVRP